MKKRMLAFFAILLVSLSVISAQEKQLSIPYEKFTLSNGLTVLLHVDRTVPRISVNTWFHVGSGYEKPGRTGFAHLFEHLMFSGSKNVPDGVFDNLIESAGGENNGSTNSDRTNYFEDLPNSALELALYVDSDRMGYLIDGMTQQKLDLQRDVVKNERRQRYENQPYGIWLVFVLENLYPPQFPYNWTTIGSMADLSAASFNDVAEFFKLYYAPNNAVLCVSGDIDIEKTKELVKKWYDEIPRGKTVPPMKESPVVLKEEKRIAFEDRVNLPRLSISWLTPKMFSPGDAECEILASILSDGKNSRLYKRLVHELQIAQDVSAFQYGKKISSDFHIIVTARKGVSLSEIEKVIQEEINKLKTTPPSEREVQKVINKFEAQFLNRLEKIGSFDGKADLLNYYYYYTGNPDYAGKDMARYKSVSPKDIQDVVSKYLLDSARVVISIVPQGEKQLAAPGTFVSKEGK